MFVLDTAVLKVLAPRGGDALHADIASRGDTAVSIPIAAALTGSGARRLRHLADTGVLKNQGQCHRRIRLQDLEALHGRRFTARDWCRVISTVNRMEGTRAAASQDKQDGALHA